MDVVVPGFQKNPPQPASGHAKCLSSASDDVDRVSLGTPDGPVEEKHLRVFQVGRWLVSNHNQHQKLNNYPIMIMIDHPKKWKIMKIESAPKIIIQSYPGSWLHFPQFLRALAIYD